MFVFAQEQPPRVVTTLGRRLFALIIAAIALVNVVKALMEVPWDTTVLPEPFFDLGGDAWERASV